MFDRGSNKSLQSGFMRRSFVIVKYNIYRNKNIFVDWKLPRVTFKTSITTILGAEWAANKNSCAEEFGKISQYLLTFNLTKKCSDAVQRWLCFFLFFFKTLVKRSVLLQRIFFQYKQVNQQYQNRLVQLVWFMI